MTTENIVEESAVADIAASSSAIERLKSNNVAVYSSFTGDDFKTKLKVSAALQSAKSIGDNLGKVIELENFIVQGIEIADENTGEVINTSRVILVDTKGESFYGISSGLLNGLENLVGVLGRPADWPEPVKVKVTEVKTRKGFKVFNLETIV